MTGLVLLPAPMKLCGSDDDDVDDDDDDDGKALGEAALARTAPPHALRGASVRAETEGVWRG